MEVHNRRTDSGAVSEKSNEVMEVICAKLTEIKELIQLRNELELYDNRIGIMKSEIRAQSKAIILKDIEISQLRAETDLLLQGIRRNETIVEWLGDVAKSETIELELTTKKKGLQKLLSMIKSIFS